MGRSLHYRFAFGCFKIGIMDEKQLYILWTTDNIITAEKMVFMYAIHALRQDWWENITIIVWGASSQLANRNPKIQNLIKKAIEAGVKVSACSVCADQLGSLEKLEEIGVELILWGKPFTELLQTNKKLITI